MTSPNFGRQLLPLVLGHLNQRATTARTSFVETIRSVLHLIVAQAQFCTVYLGMPISPSKTWHLLSHTIYLIQPTCLPMLFITLSALKPRVKEGYTVCFQKKALAR